MKSSILSFWQAGLACVFLTVCGCTSQTSKSAGAPSANTPAAEKAPSVDDAIRKAASMPSEPVEGTGWKSLFDGKTLRGWQVTQFGGHGPVNCQDGLMIVDMGDALSGVNWTNTPPKSNYEIVLDAMRLDGSDFFCGLTFPVGQSHCSLILGGWGGTVVGISSIDGQDASENETTKFIRFESDRWYRIRIRVTDAKIEAWLDKDKIVDLPLADRKITLRFGDIDMSLPLGVATYQTTAAFRNLKWRSLGPAN